jgi:hypothetical protein
MSMRIDLCGGFGEKGRTSVAISGSGQRILLDAGIKVGASGPEYYPVLAGGIDDIDAVLISHAHEDHVGALSWLLSQGYRGRILMTSETRDESPETLRAYADPAELADFPFPAERIEIFAPGETLAIGGLNIATGRSGHVVGGVWFAVEDGKRKVVYSADVVPDSSVFLMDPMPRCDLLVFDASYGADPVTSAARARAIGEWVSAHPGGCLVPTPLSGRSLELMAILPGPIAIHAAMRASLAAQIEATSALHPAMVPLLRRRLAEACDWHDGEPLPPCPLLADDGMGKAGPSATLLPRADATGYPVLLTGHLPAGSPGEMLQAAGRAGWIRMPTHPTLSGNLAIWEGAGRPMALGHSCLPDALQELAPHMPSLRADLRTGDSFTLAP